MNVFKRVIYILVFIFCLIVQINLFLICRWCQLRPALSSPQRPYWPQYKRQCSWWRCRRARQQQQPPGDRPSHPDPAAGSEGEKQRGVSVGASASAPGFSAPQPRCANTFNSCVNKTLQLNRQSIPEPTSRAPQIKKSIYTIMFGRGFKCDIDPSFSHRNFGGRKNLFFSSQRLKPNDIISSCYSILHTHFFQFTNTFFSSYLRSLFYLYYASCSNKCYLQECEGSNRVFFVLD